MSTAQTALIATLLGPLSILLNPTSVNVGLDPANPQNIPPIGVWQGNEGINIVIVPSTNAATGNAAVNFLQHTYVEKLQFDFLTLNANRGGTTQQFVAGLEYEQTVIATNIQAKNALSGKPFFPPIHQENGFISYLGIIEPQPAGQPLQFPATAGGLDQTSPPGPTGIANGIINQNASANLVRQGNVPHGNALLLLGQAIQTPAAPAPAPQVSFPPFDPVNTPPATAQDLANLIDGAFAAFQWDQVINGQNIPGYDAKFQALYDGTGAIAALKNQIPGFAGGSQTDNVIISPITTLFFSTKVTGSNIASIPFESGTTSSGLGVGDVQSVFWIYQVQRPDQTTFFQLQYLQVIILNFNRSPPNPSAAPSAAPSANPSSHHHHHGNDDERRVLAEKSAEAFLQKAANLRSKRELYTTSTDAPTITPTNTPPPPTTPLIGWPHINLNTLQLNTNCVLSYALDPSCLLTPPPLNPPTTSPSEAPHA